MIIMVGFRIEVREATSFFPPDSVSEMPFGISNIARHVSDINRVHDLIGESERHIN